MIIKKGLIKRDDAQKDGSRSTPKTNLPNQLSPQMPPNEGPRPERRRGDRRRGYRRIDDRNLISRAHEEANAIRETSYREGFEYGLEKSTERIREFAQILTELINARDTAIRMSVSDIAEMAVMVAEKIIKKEVELDPAIVVSITSEVIKDMGKGHQSIVIKVNPADVPMVREHLPQIYPYGDSRTSIVVVEDNTVEWGSCIVETNTGLVDARFSTQLEILKKAFEVGI